MSLGNSILVFSNSGGGGGIQSIVAGLNIIVDNTDPLNPIVSSNGTNIAVVANYSALPPVATVPGQFFWCSASQGTPYIGGLWGGTYYSAGLYHSNGVTYEYLDVPYQATLAGVNAGTITDQFVTPFTLANTTLLTNKISLNGSSPATTGRLLMGAYLGLTWNSTTNATTVTGNDSLGFVEVKGQNYVRIISSDTSNNVLRISNFNGWYSNIIQPNGYNTDITMPSSTGTLALLSDIPSTTGFITLTSLSATSPLLYNNTTGVFSIQGGSASQNGYISSTDWNTFNNKQASLVSGTNIKTLYGSTLLGSGDAGIAPSAYGGTGVNNGSSTITIGGNVVFSGAFNATIAVPRTTTWTLPNTALETLAGLGTAQTFTAQNTFSNSSGTNIYSLLLRNQANTNYLNAASFVNGSNGDNLLLGAGLTSLQRIRLATSLEVNDGNTGTYRTAISSNGTNTGLFGTGFSSAHLSGSSTAKVTWSTAEVAFGFGGTFNIAIGGINPVFIGGLQNGLFTISTIAPTTGSNPSANLYITTGVPTTAATGAAGNVCIDPGNKGSGSVKGNTQIGFGSTTVAANSMEGGIAIANRIASPTINLTGGTYLYANANNLETTGSFYFPLIGTGMGVKVGTNGRFFTATLVAGTVTVSNTSITTNTKAIITIAPGGGVGTLGNYTYTVSSGSITITSVTSTLSTQVLDLSTVQVYLIEGL